MAINKAMRLALKALSYPEADIKKLYKLQRSFEIVKTPFLLKPLLYKNWDHKVVSGGREITVRIYTPREKTRNDILLFFHGGRLGNGEHRYLQYRLYEPCGPDRL